MSPVRLSATLPACSDLLLEAEYEEEISMEEDAWCFPAEAAAAAEEIAVDSTHPYWAAGGKMIAPQAAFRKAEACGYTPKQFTTATRVDIVDRKYIQEQFVGAVLCDSIKVTRHILTGGYGRGWEAEFSNKDTGALTKVFVKTLGVIVTDADSWTVGDKLETASEHEHKARVEAKVLTHKWFAPATDQPGAAVQRLCFGRCVNPTTGFDGNIFFICGELCTGGELYEYSVHDESLADQFARRVFGQLARSVFIMKHAGEFVAEESNQPSTDHPAPVVKGCSHRDLKLGNVILTGDFNCKIMDYGSLKFTDKMVEEVGTQGKIRYNAKTMWHGSAEFWPPDFHLNSPDMVEKDGYDPASWDVWSLGSVLLYCAAGATLFKELQYDVYRFFWLAMRVGPREEGDKCTSIFYDMDEDGFAEDTDARGIPIVERTLCSETVCATDANPSGAVGNHCPAQGVPINRRLWQLLGEIDPDYDPSDPTVTEEASLSEKHELSESKMERAVGESGMPTPIHPQLKDLLNRMLDVDPETRITIEDVCQHPWLRSHQAPDSAISEDAVESSAQREAYTAEMQRRFSKYVGGESSDVARTLSHAKNVAVTGLTEDHCFEILRQYAHRETGLIATRVTHDTESVAIAPPLKDAEVHESFPMFEVYREGSLPGASAHVPLYRATLRPTGLTLEWVPHSIIKSGELVNVSATLGEWHHFRETVTSMMAQLTPRPSRRTPSLSRKRILAQPVGGTQLAPPTLEL